MRFFFFALIAACGLTICCCPKEKEREEPPFPTEKVGWHERIEQGARIQGSFILRIGEAVDNGRVQIRLVELIPKDRCVEAAAFQAQARAKFQFERIADQVVLCESTFGEHGGGSVECSDAVNKLGIISIGVRALNLKEGWVFFEVY